jgi:predicted permease
MSNRSWRRYARFWGEDYRADIEDELSLHREMRVDEAKSRGLDDAAARAEMVRAFGDVEAIRSELDVIARRRNERSRRSRAISDIVYDTRLALRALLRQRGYAAGVVLILALGLGTSLAILSLVKGVLLSPLPYPEPDRLAVAWERNIPRSSGENVVSVGAWEDWAARSRSFTALASIVPDHATILGDEAVRVQGASVSASWFDVVAVKPAVGRAFTDADANADAPVIVLSHRMWQTRFNSDPRVIGTRIALADRPRTIVGVMPASFDPPAFGWMDSDQQYWVPFAATEGNRQWGRFLLVLGRLRPEATLAAADAELKAINAERVARVDAAASTGASDWTVDVVGLRDQMTGDVRTALLILFAAAALLLTTALVNVSNLVLLRFHRRHSEFAVRSALGAGRWRLMRQLFAEACIVVAITAPIAMVFASGLLRVLVRVMSSTMPRSEYVHIDYSVLLWMAPVLIVAVMLLAALPALRISRTRLESWLRAGSSRATARYGGGGIVVAEVALAIVLSIGAGLALRTYVNLRTERLGFEPDATLSFRINLDAPRYSEPEARTQFIDQLTTALQAIPGTRDVAVTTIRPLAGGGTSTTMTRTGSGIAALVTGPNVDVRTVSPSYFRTLGIETDGGENTFARARPGTPVVALLSRAAARSLFGRENAVGQSIIVDFNNHVTAEVTGVVEDVRARGPGEEEKATVYFAIAQDVPSRIDVLVRSDMPAAELGAAVRSRLHTIDGAIPAENVQTLSTIVAEATRPQRTTLLLLAAFALSALVLAGAGIYAVLAMQVAQRRRELSIRYSLGATPSRIRFEVMAVGFRQIAAGCAIGLAASLLCARFMNALLYNVGGMDPMTYGGVVVTILVIGAVASAVPARSASRTEPAEALRNT